MTDTITMKHYVLSVRRSEWSTHSISDALADLADVEGIEVTGQRHGRRTRVSLSDDAFAVLNRDRLPPYCNLEPLKPFAPQ